MKEDIIKKAEAIIQQNTVQSGPEGSIPSASTITPSKAQGIQWISFCTGLGSTKSKRILDCSKASVCFNTGGDYNITLTGWMEVSTAPDILHEM